MTCVCHTRLQQRFLHQHFCHVGKHFSPRWRLQFAQFVNATVQKFKILIVHKNVEKKRNKTEGDKQSWLLFVFHLLDHFAVFSDMLTLSSVAAPKRSEILN